jgi:DNA-binding MarR family transcriptional regulator
MRYYSRVMHYLRKEKPLTSYERGVFITLVIRMGNNAYTDVSQEDLAIEVGISERQIRQHIANFKTKGLIKISKDPKDNRKNIYHLASFLIDYKKRKTTSQSSLSSFSH